MILCPFPNNSTERTLWSFLRWKWLRYQLDHDTAKSLTTGRSLSSTYRYIKYINFLEVVLNKVSNLSAQRRGSDFISNSNICILFHFPRRTPDTPITQEADPTLSESEEQMLTEFIKKTARIGYPVTDSELLDTWSRRY